MRAYKRMAKFSILIAIISLLIAILLNFCFAIDKTGFWINVCLGLFGSATLTILTSVVSYFHEKRQTLENFVYHTRQILSYLNKYQESMSLEQKLKFYLDYHDLDKSAWDMDIGNMDFFSENKTHDFQYIYTAIYKPILDFNRAVENHVWHFRWYLDGTGKNDTVMEKFLLELQEYLLEKNEQDMFTDGHETKVKDNPLNDNFAKDEFQALWKQINHKYAYTVEFDSEELIRKSVVHINEKLFVSELQYTTTIGQQKAEMNEHEVGRGASFTGEKTRTQTLNHAQTSQIKYDLIGKIAEGTDLTRKTVAAILKGLRVDKLYMFKNNPEEFISKVIKLIKEQKATMIVEHITYNQIEGEYDSTIFTAEKSSRPFDKAFRAKRAIQDYVFTDGSAEESVERRFVEDLDSAYEVCVYAKLPKGFHIPTPVGNYSPDWAIAFKENTVKHIFFVAETKGTMDSLNLKPIEQAKISCAKKLFNEMSTSNVKYHDVDSYQNLLNVMKSL